VSGDSSSGGDFDSSLGLSSGGSTAFLRRVRVFFAGAEIDGATLAPALRLSSSVESVDGLICPLVALAAISPSFVVGRYAPPANLNPHFLHNHIPTLHRLTVRNLHRGHSCLVLSLDTISTYCRRVTVPYRAPNPPARPSRLGIRPSLLPGLWSCSPRLSALLG
jgi:hypothetical protein